jgi:hypothetical protein
MVALLDKLASPKQVRDWAIALLECRGSLGTPQTPSTRSSVYGNASPNAEQRLTGY